MVAAQPIHMTEAEYIAFEDDSDIRHEYVNGEVYAMTGATWTHNVICSNVNIALGTQLADQACTVVANELRLKVASKVSYRYPDLMVICGAPVFVENREDTINNPTIIFEVLSPSTSLVDRNQKFHEYIQLDSVQAYVLISQNTVQVERFLHQETGEWLYKQMTSLANTLELPSISCTLALADVYNKLTLGDNE